MLEGCPAPLIRLRQVCLDQSGFITIASSKSSLEPGGFLTFLSDRTEGRTHKAFVQCRITYYNSCNYHSRPRQHKPDQIADPKPLIPPLPTQPPLANLPKNRPVIRLPQILLGNPPILLQQQPSRPKLEKRSAPSKRIPRQPMPPNHVPELPRTQPVLLPIPCTTSSPPGKQILKSLRHEPPLPVIHPRVRPVLGLVDPAHVDPEPRVRNDRARQARRVREVDVDDHHGCKRKEHREPELPKADVRVPRPDLPVSVAVPEEDVLLQDCVFLEFSGVLGAAGGVVGRDGEVGAGDGGFVDFGGDEGEGLGAFRGCGALRDGDVESGGGGGGGCAVAEETLLLLWMLWMLLLRRW